MNNYNELQRSGLVFYYVESDKLIIKATRPGGNMMSISDYQKMSDDLEKEFRDIKAVAVPEEKDEITRNDRHKFRERNAQTIFPKSENEMLAERLFNEVHYHIENEDRRTSEITRMKQIIQNAERGLASAKEIKIKQMITDLLIDREALSDLEKDLYQDIVKFKEVFERANKGELMMRLKVSQVEREDELRKLKKLRNRKENVDTERHRIKTNLEILENGTFQGIQTHCTDALNEAKIRRVEAQKYQNPYDVDLLKHKINQGTERIKDLRKEREDLIKHGIQTRDKREITAQINLNEEINRYLSQIEGSSVSPERKADILLRFREKMARYVDNNGIIDPSEHQTLHQILRDFQNKYDLSSEGRNKQTRGMNSPPDSYRPIQNHVTPEAEALVQHKAHLGVLRKEMAALPTQSQLYHNKLIQSQNIMAIIHELEKIVMEQAIQREWDIENAKSENGRRDDRKMKKEIADRLRACAFGPAEQGSSSVTTGLNDEQMKHETALRLRQNVFGPLEKKTYDRNAGFAIAFEAMFGLPKKYVVCQVIYGVYRRGEMMSSPKLIEYKICKHSKTGENKCMFNEAYTIFDVQPHMDTLVVFEFQCLSDAELNMDEGSEVIGWTMIDMFDMMKTFKKGKWKVPVYFKPTNTNIEPSKIKSLKRQKELWFYIRASLPHDENFIYEGINDPDAPKQGYEIPELHTRFWNETQPPVEDYHEDREIHKAKKPKDLLPMPIPIPVQNVVEEGYAKPKPIVSDRSYKPAPKQKDLFKDIFNNRGYDSEDEEEEENKSVVQPDNFNLMEELAKSDDQSRSSFRSPAMEMTLDLNYNKGLKVTIIGLQNFVFENSFKITGGLMENNEFVLDENARDCVFSTKSRLLDDLFAYGGKNDDSRMKGSFRMTSLAVEETVIFNETFYFLRNLPGLIAMRQNKLNLLLVMQVIGVGYDMNAGKQKKQKDKKKLLDVSEGEDDFSRRHNPADDNVEDKYNFVSWHVIKLNLDNGRLTQGRFIEPLYSPPMVKPPFEGKKLIKTGSKIEFIVEDYIYDADTLKKQKQEAHKPNKPEMVKPNFSRIEAPKQSKKETAKASSPESVKKPMIQVGLKPFIPNYDKQHAQDPFQRGHGIDFYIDGAKFLPDNVTVLKVTLNVLTQDGTPIMQPERALAELDSLSLNPIFKLKAELRAPYFNPTCIALISIETIDVCNDEVRTVGHCAINLFLNGETHKPPFYETDTEFLLMEGCYQLPIYCQLVTTAKPFTLDKITKLDKLPCSSLLVRIVEAPMAHRDLIPLSKASVPEKDWQKSKVVIPAPAYASGNYSTELYGLTHLEEALFTSRQSRHDLSVRQKAVRLMAEEGHTESLTDKDIHEWINKKVLKSNALGIIDLVYIAKYQPSLGFRIAIDGFHNVPEKVPYVSLCCLNPPGALFQDPPNMKNVCMNSQFNWDSPITSPQFLEDFFRFQDISFKKNLNLIIEVKTIIFNKKSVPLIKPVGWTVLPIFNSDGYVQAGIFQLPIFKGTIPKDTLQHITYNDAWPYLMDLMRVKKSPVQLLEPMSVIVRLLDAQREGHYRKPFDFDRISYKYLPQPKSHLYVYNALVENKLKTVKKLSTTVATKGESLEIYNARITEALSQAVVFLIWRQQRKLRASDSF